MEAINALARPAALALAAAGLVLAGCGGGGPARDSANAGTQPSPSPAPTDQQDSGPQRGIDISFYKGDLGPGNTVANESPGYIRYVKGLGADWVSITFPVFESPGSASVVVRQSPTPSPRDLSILINDAEAAGLSVVLRPLLDESTMGHSRVHWRPSDLASWFASYQRLILPYATMAQRDHVQVFTVGVEFDRFAASRRWNTVDAAIRRVYSGQLAYADNWDKLPTRRGYGGRHVRQDVDAYPGFNVPSSASIALLSRKWRAWARPLRPGTVLSEVGISAQAGAYPRPYVWTLPNEPINYRIQVRWFAAACNAVVSRHLGGIFFWSLPFGSSLTVPSRLADPGAWTASPGARAIARCFTKLTKAG